MGGHCLTVTSDRKLLVSVSPLGSKGYRDLRLLLSEEEHVGMKRHETSEAEKPTVPGFPKTTVKVADKCRASGRS